MDNIIDLGLMDKLRAIRIYCEGIKEDFPETAIWMDNIIHITILPKETGADRCMKIRQKDLD